MSHHIQHKYGELPKELGVYEIKPTEMMFYQYLPIKLSGQNVPKFEDRLSCFKEIVGAICCDFIGEFGLNRYVESYVYLTAKYMYQKVGCAFNREGYHSDGFMTNDINYIWCDSNPTIFNFTDFNISMDDILSINQMECQAVGLNEKRYSPNQLLRLNQYNVHKVAPIEKEGMRTFLKISFSNDKYDLLGNSHNYLLNYNWEMRIRCEHRNIPQKL